MGAKVGGLVSSTVTANTRWAAFPCRSVARHETCETPRGKVEPDAGTHVAFTAPSTRSRAETVNATGKLRIWAGSYLTVDQDEGQSIVSGEVLLQRFLPNPDRDTEERARLFMWEERREVCAEENHRLDLLWTSYHAS